MLSIVSARQLVSSLVLVSLLISSLLGVPRLVPLPSVAAQAGITYYVNAATGDDINAGTSWGEAFATLQQALTTATIATSGAEIWVATGVYTAGTQRTDSFVLVDDVAIYGGFTGTETSRDQRDPDPTTNGTILSGDIDGNDTGDPTDGDSDGTPDELGDNAYHVVTSNFGTTNTAVLDGFTITAGNADGSSTFFAVGGGVFNAAGSPILNNINIQGNRANGSGGGVYNTFNNPTITNATIQNNQAGDFGGGMYNLSNIGGTFSNILITNNTSGTSGGGVANTNNNSNTTFTNVTITNNTANDGGGVANSSSNTMFADVTISDNTATNSGGGVLNSNSDATFTDVIISGNVANGTLSASGGGGFYNDLGGVPELTDVMITDNTATNNGGGVFSNNGEPALTRVDISNNNATGRGGGMFINNGDPILTSVSISSNGSSSDGGGFYNESGNPELINVNIFNNVAIDSGGGFYNNLGAVTLTNLTIADNTANASDTGGSGGGFYNGDTLTVQNSIIWSNSPDQVDNILTVTYNNSLVDGHMAAALDSSGSGGANNLDGDQPGDDPLFANPTAGNYRLTQGSPVIDLGENTFNTEATDLGGITRIIDGGTGSVIIDPGAYEYDPTNPTSVKLLSFVIILGQETILNWVTLSEIGVSGYMIERDDGTGWTQVSEFLPAEGFGSTYTWIDPNLQVSTRYRLVVINTDQSREYYLPNNTITTATQHYLPLVIR